MSIAWHNATLALAAPAGCRLWLIDLSHPLDNTLWLNCDDAERTRAGRFHFERDARRYRAAHAHMRHLLGQALNVPPQNLHWRLGRHGKPHLTGHEGWHFNLSHSGDWALLGLSNDRLIGVDIECHKPMPDMGTLASTLFSIDEQATLSQGSDAERETFFFRTWACKEACLKALGCGLMLEPRHIQAPWQPMWAVAQARTPDQLFSLQVHGIALPPEAQKVQAAVALLSPDEMAPGHLALLDW